MEQPHSYDVNLFHRGRFHTQRATPPCLAVTPTSPPPTKVSMCMWAYESSVCRPAVRRVVWSDGGLAISALDLMLGDSSPLLCVVTAVTEPPKRFTNRFTLTLIDRKMLRRFHHLYFICSSKLFTLTWGKKCLEGFEYWIFLGFFFHIRH